MARSTGWSQCCGAKGAPTCVSGRVWVEQLESEITLLTSVLEAVTKLVVVVQGVASPRASACAKAAAISKPQADVGASSALGTVIAGAGRPLGWLWVDLCWLDILDGPVNPRVHLLRVQPAEASGQEGSCALMLEPSWRDDITTITSPLLGAFPAFDGEPS